LKLTDPKHPLPGFCSPAAAHCHSVQLLVLLPAVASIQGPCRAAICTVPPVQRVHSDYGAPLGGSATISYARTSSHSVLRQWQTHAACVQSSTRALCVAERPDAVPLFPLEHRSLTPTFLLLCAPGASRRHRILHRPAVPRRADRRALPVVLVVPRRLTGHCAGAGGPLGGPCHGGWA
jgi:hypothetical protein